MDMLLLSDWICGIEFLDTVVEMRFVDANGSWKLSGRRVWIPALYWFSGARSAMNEFTA